jgi:adenylate cyclase
VFVGTTALGTREVVATPLDTLFVGVEVQATVADNLLQQDFISRSQVGTVLEGLVVLVLGVAVTWLVASTGTPAGVLGSASHRRVWYFAGGCSRRRRLRVAAVAHDRSGSRRWRHDAREIHRRARTGGHGRREKTNAQRLMVQTLLSLTETRDAETGRHSRRTQQYVGCSPSSCQPIRIHSYLTPERIDLVSSLAPLHDIGKVGVPDHILNKPGALTPDELAEMRKHPQYGYEVILKAEGRVGVRDDAILAMAKDIVYTHHERWDGTGYPRKTARHGDSMSRPGDGRRRCLRRHHHEDALSSADVA